MDDARPHPIDEAQLRGWLRLLRTRALPAADARLLLTAHGSAAAAVEAGPRAWRALGIRAAACDALPPADDPALAADLAFLSEPGRSLLTIDDPRYPARLAEIGDPPLALFCIGDPELLGTPQLAIVGARQATPQGLENAQAFAEAAARRALVVTSGLALGIDGAAHRGALAAKGLTVAVCGTGLDRVYPARHRALAHQIAQEGLLISELPPGMPALAHHFPRRNRLIAGLSLGVLVVEAARESGSLTTARLATEYGREVFAIPGSIHNPMARGCHKLIRQGAKLVETLDDILEELAGALSAFAPPPHTALDAGSACPPAASDEPLWTALGDAPMGFDELAGRLGWPVERVAGELLRLELEGRVTALPGGRLMRVHRR